MSVFGATAVVYRCLLEFIDICTSFDDGFGHLCTAICVLFVIFFALQTLFPLLILDLGSDVWYGCAHLAILPKATFTSKETELWSTKSIVFFNTFPPPKKNSDVSNIQSAGHWPKAFSSVFIYGL